MQHAVGHDDHAVAADRRTGRSHEPAIERLLDRDVLEHSLDDPVDDLFAKQRRVRREAEVDGLADFRRALTRGGTLAIVGGDAKCRSIAAASIVAKVTRDRLMAERARDYPGYGWETNRGYGTPEHYRGLEALGVTPLHRRSFAPVREIIARSNPR